MENKYYIYVYLDQRKKGKWLFRDVTFEYQPFYVGKGCGNRITTHLSSHMLKSKNYKNSTIKSIITEINELPIHYRIYDELSESRSLELEKEFI